MLQLFNYKKTYSTEPVLHIPKLEIEMGIYWLQGENGAGKTTFLKSIAGLVPFEGDIWVDGTSLRKERMTYTRKVAFAEAEPLFPSFLTGLELIQFFSQTKGENTLIVERFADEMHMHGYLQNKVGSYSSGMMKKLSLLLAFVGNPKLILLDEPFVTLDVNAVEVLQEIISSHANDGVAFIISSHQELALANPNQILKVHQQTIEPISHVIPVQ